MGNTLHPIGGREKHCKTHAQRDASYVSRPGKPPLAGPNGEASEEQYPPLAEARANASEMQHPPLEGAKANASEM